MIQNKGNNGWILCPSKTFPGKFYYFNVVNGEAAWSLNEIENNIQKKDGVIQRIADKLHTYPEPSSPPLDERPKTQSESFLKNTPLISMPQRVGHNTQTPTFGHVSFQKYINPYMSNIIWTPIQLPQPMYVGNPQEMRNVNRIQSSEPEQRLFVQTCSVSLSDRFSYLSQPQYLKTDNSHIQYYDPTTPNNAGDSGNTANLEHNSFNNLHIPKPKLIKEAVFKRVQTQSESNQSLRRSVSMKEANSLKSLLNFDDSALPKSTVNSDKKSHNAINSNKASVDNVKAPKGALTPVHFENLDRRDLRFLLEAKRKKSVNFKDLPEMTEDNKKKVSTKEVEKTPKKQVTFDLGLDEISEGSFHETGDDIQPQDCDMLSIEATEPEGLLFVVVDFATLLDDFQTIEDYVQADDKRRLVIPPKLRAEVEAACLGDCCGRQRVMLARQIARKMAAPPEHYVLVPEPEGSPAEEGNYVLHCCMDIGNSDNAVVLITNDSDLYNNAKILNIKCYKAQEIKDGNSFAKPEVSFDFKKIKFSVNNENKEKSTKKTENLFLQPVTEIESFIVSKDQIPVNTYKKRLFQCEANEKTACSSKKILKDANTSPINGDKLIDITRKRPTKQRIYYDNMKDSNTSPIMPKMNNDKFIEMSKKTTKLNKFSTENSCTTQIGFGMKNLFIKDCQKNVNKKETSSGKRPTIEDENKFTDLGKACDKLPIELSETQRNELEDLRHSFNSTKAKTHSLNQRLRTFGLQCKDIGSDWKLRIHEWMCVFTQIVENALVDVLMRDSPITDKLSQPWVLYEATKRIQDLYGSHAELKLVTEKFRELLLKCSKIGKVNDDSQPYDLMELIGCGIILIESLKEILPNYKELQEADLSLRNLRQNLAQPIEEEMLVLQTPVLRSGEMDDKQTDDRHNFVKKPADIIEYLKAHNPEWKNVDAHTDSNLKKNEPKVLRTFGRDLKLLKIDNSKFISLKKSAESLYFDGIEKYKPKTEKSVNKSQESRPIPNLQTIINSYNKKQPIAFDNTFTIPKIAKSNPMFTPKNESKTLPPGEEDVYESENGNTFNQDNVTTRPNITRTTGNLFKTVTTENANIGHETKKTSVNPLKNNNLPVNEPNHCNTEKKSPIVTRTLNSLFKNIHVATPMAIDIEELNVPKNGNTFDQENDTAGPQVIRNVKPIEDFEEIFKKNSEIFDLDALDYSDIDENDENVSKAAVEDIISIVSKETVSFVYEIKQRKTLKNNDNALDNGFVKDEIKCESSNNSNCLLYNENALHNDNDSWMDEISADKMATINENMNDSEFENESIRAYAWVQTFLVEISESLKAIYMFIDKSVHEFRDELEEDRILILRDKANTTAILISGIIDKLKSIIQRESNEATTLKAMLLKAGVQATTDKRMTRYRQVVTKCLEQAQMLESALKTMLTLTKQDIESPSTASANSDIRYFNIFE